MRFSSERANRNFRFFSPDETYSNKLDEIFKTVKRLRLADKIDGHRYGAFRQSNRDVERAQLAG